MFAWTKVSCSVDKMEARHGQKEIISSRLREGKVHFYLAGEKETMGWKNPLYGDLAHLALHQGNVRLTAQEKTGSLQWSLSRHPIGEKSQQVVPAVCCLWHSNQVASMSKVLKCPWEQAESVLLWVKRKAGTVAHLTGLSQRWIL